MHFSPRYSNFRVIRIIFLGLIEFALRGVYCNQNSIIASFLAYDK